MVPTRILICVTPDEKMLGINLLKKNFVFWSIFTLMFSDGLKFLFTKNSKIKNCNNPENDTA